MNPKSLTNCASPDLPGQTSDCALIRYEFRIEVTRPIKNHARIRLISTDSKDPEQSSAFALEAQECQNRLKYALK